MAQAPYVVVCVILAALPGLAHGGTGDSGGGTVAGLVKLTAAPPAAKPLQATKDPRICGRTLPDQTYVVGPAGALANVVVVIEDVHGGEKIDPPRAELKNHGCLFVPRVATYPVGTTLWLVNEDATLHNVHAYLDGSRTLFNLALPMQGYRAKKKLKKPGVVEFRCDAGHTWMRAFAVVTEHPYAAVTDAAGRFAIAGVPPGRHRLRAWHEAAGEKRAKVNVTAGETATVEITY